MSIEDIIEFATACLCEIIYDSEEEFITMNMGPYVLTEDDAKRLRIELHNLYISHTIDALES